MTLSRPAPRPSAQSTPSEQLAIDANSLRYVVTANDPFDGGVRYLQLGADGWTRIVARATTAHGAEARDALLAMARIDVGNSLILDPYAIEVSGGPVR